jgi:hypothetical protein
MATEPYLTGEDSSSTVRAQRIQNGLESSVRFRHLDLKAFSKKL